MTSARPRVLVVDNDPGIVEAISTRLDSLGIEPIGAGTGLQAMSVLDSDAVDLVITDINMPAGDGLEILAHMRSANDTPCIIVTGAEINPDIQELMDSGYALFRKPFNSSSLVELVVSMLDEKANAPIKQYNLARNIVGE